MDGCHSCHLHGRGKLQQGRTWGCHCLRGDACSTYYYRRHEEGEQGGEHPKCKPGKMLGPKQKEVLHT